MPVSIRKTLPVFLLFALVACSTPPEIDASPTVQVLQISYSPALQPVTRRIRECAQNFPEIALFMEEIPASHLNTQEQDIVLWLGLPPETAQYAFPIGQEEIQVVIHPENQVDGLTDADIRSLFNGHFTSWDEVDGIDSEVSVWIFPPENEVQRYFTESFMDSDDYSSFARIAPDPAAMVEAVSTDRGAIGILPGSWEGGSLKITEINDSIHLPVLALTAKEPAGVARELLACIQSTSDEDNAP